MWQSGGVLFLALKMSQDPVDDVLLLDASDDFDRPTAATANLDVDFEHALESLGPGHSSMALGRCPYFRICARLKCLATSGRSDFPAPAMVRSKDAMESREIDPRFWHEGRQSRNEVHGFECYLGRSVPVRKASSGYREPCR